MELHKETQSKPPLVLKLLSTHYLVESSLKTGSSFKPFKTQLFALVMNCGTMTTYAFLGLWLKKWLSFMSVRLPLTWRQHFWGELLQNTKICSKFANESSSSYQHPSSYALLNSEHNYALLFLNTKSAWESRIEKRERWREKERENRKERERGREYVHSDIECSNEHLITPSYY